MAENKSIKKNFLLNALLTASSFIFPIITFPYVSRILLPEGTGNVSFATSVISYFSMFAQLGIPTYGIRVCAKVRDDRERLSRAAHELLAISLLTSLIAYAALFGLLRLVPRFQSDRPLYWIISATILLNTIGMEWLYKALEQYSYITVRSIAFKLVALVLTFALVHAREDYVIYGGVSIFAASASNILNLVNARRHIDFRYLGGYDLKRHLRPILFFFAMACATTVYTNLDTVMLGLMATKADVGYYQAAVKIKTVLVGVVTALGPVVLPRASYYIEQGDVEQFRRIGRKALNLVLVASLPLMLYFMLFARPGILLLSGSAFMGSVTPMRVIMPTLLFIGITNILGIQILVPTDRESVVLRSVVAGAVVDVIVNALLIPRMASTGAAIGTVVAEAVVLWVQYRALRREMGNAFRSIQYGKLLLALAAGTAASAWALWLDVGAFLQLLVSATLFFGAYGGALLLTQEPLTLECLDIARRFAAKLAGRGR